MPSSDDSFADPFSRAHYANRINGLVGGDHEHAVHISGSASQVPSAKDIVLSGLNHVGFHQWDMFVCCGVEDKLDLTTVNDVGYPVCIADICEGNSKIQFGAQLPQSIFELEQFALTLI